MRRLGRFHGIEQLATGDEYHAGAGDGEQPPTGAGINFEIMAPRSTAPRAMA